MSMNEQEKETKKHDECEKNSGDNDSVGNVIKLKKRSVARSVTPVQYISVKWKRVFWLVVAAVCIVALAACTVYLCERQREQNRREQLRQMAGAMQTTAPPRSEPMASATPASTQAPTPSPTPEEWPAPKVYKPNERNIDFEELLSENQDVIGWIEVPGTDIDYPLLANSGDDYYLDHDFYREKSVYGAVFIDKSNQNDFDRSHVILYGHNMKDGSMFAGLHAFEDKVFFDGNRMIKIYTPKGQLNFEIFAAYERDDAYIPGTYDMGIKVDFEDYLATIKAAAGEKVIIDMDDVTADDSIITLSTCVRGEDEMRYVVQAKYMSVSDR